MGRHRTPVSDKIRNGTYRPDRDRNVPKGQELILLPSDTNTPLNDIGMSYFTRIGSFAISMGILESQDLDALEDLAYNWQERWQIESKIKQEEDREIELIKKLESDDVQLDKVYYHQCSNLLNHTQKKISTLHRRSKSIYDNIQKGMSRFGLNPIDRQKLEIDKLVIESDPLDEMM